MTHKLEQLKQTVKSHTIVPFNTHNIACNHDKLIISDRYIVRQPKKILETLGIRDNLIKEIFEKPDVNWSAIRDALNTIDDKKTFGGIVDEHNRMLTLTKPVKEETQLNFDKRLDELFNGIDESKSHEIQSAIWSPSDCAVHINSVNQLSEIECGGGDNWKFGTTSIIGDTMQQFKNYFLRLVCTNGMTTRDNIAYRAVTASVNIAKQFLKFASNDAFASQIIPRVDRLRNNRASLYELTSIANCLDAEQRESLMPEYDYTVQHFENAGYPIDNFTAARKRFIYTNENLYDIFNLATNLATHQRDVIGDMSAMQLNKVAGEIFSKGPNLDIQILDLWKN